MSDRENLGQEVELLQSPENRPRNHTGASGLIHHLSESDTERGSQHHSLEHEARKKQKTVRRRGGSLFEGWKFTIFLAFISSLVVLFFNIGFLLYHATHNKGGNERVVYEGNCDTSRYLNMGLHLIINVLSTILLSASNFGMQCLSAPTRQSIDRAHKKGRWLDVGVPSVRNLFRVSTKRSLLWLCLSFTSLPFHLVYNSAIFPTTAVPAYDVFAGPGTLGMLETPHFNTTVNDDPTRTSLSFQKLFQAAKNQSLHALDNAQCIKDFAETYQTKWAKVLLVTQNVQGNDSYALTYTNPVYNANAAYHTFVDSYFSLYDISVGSRGPYDWMCRADSYPDCATTKISIMQQWVADNDWVVDNWMVNQSDPAAEVEYRVESCLAEKMPQHCKLQYSLPVIMVVIFFNLGKSAVLFYMWLGVSKSPILTIGDAIASFLRHPDSCSQDMCLQTNLGIKKIPRPSTKLPEKRIIHHPIIFSRKRKLWGSAVSKSRWAFSIILWLASFLIVILLLILTLRIPDVWSYGPGSVSSQTIIQDSGWPNTFLPNVIIANLPQLTFSFLYFAFNSLLTAMCLAAEWSRFAISRKAIRVSNNPVVSQRSNYFLSIPYRYGIPLMAASATLHWLISESLFMVSVQAYDADMNRDPSSDIYACGYSPVSMLSTLSVGAFMFLCLVGLSLRPFASAMPVAGACSLAIAAACHPSFNPNRNVENLDNTNGMDMESENEVDDMAALPIQWGAIPLVGPIGHCSFTSGEVIPPEEGKEYQ